MADQTLPKPKFVTVLIECTLRDGSQRVQRAAVAPTMLEELKSLLASKLEIRAATVWVQEWRTHKSYAEDFAPEKLEAFVAELKAGEHIDLSAAEDMPEEDHG